jgi:hypothetical protein
MALVQGWPAAMAALGMRSPCEDPQDLIEGNSRCGNRSFQTLFRRNAKMDECLFAMKPAPSARGFSWSTQRRSPLPAKPRWWTPLRNDGDLVISVALKGTALQQSHGEVAYPAALDSLD